VFFKFNKAELTPEAKTVLAEVVRNAGTAKASKIVGTGYAGRAGNSAYNEQLSKRRVDAVVSYLLESGIETSKIVTASHGERQLPVKTAEAQTEQQNRRVEIRFAQ
jgi:outer membrane protein OmpA-like peptidoglycan-associated protein